MRYGIIADIHSNLEAFEEVLEHLKGEVDQIVCAGDVVGYNPNPNECCEIIIKNKILTVAGNHDFAVAGKIDVSFFNLLAQSAISWTSSVIRPENLEFLKNLPIHLEFDDFEVVHGSLRNNLEEYIIARDVAYASFEMMKKPLLFVGHTHKPALLFLSNKGSEGFLIKGEGTFPVRDIGKVILNAGSVGQPRDGDPRAGYIIYDSEKKEASVFRTSYDVQAVQDRMLKAGFPGSLVERLRIGF